ncbi:MAG: hypothetical protein M1839_002327 [Geoglossum umbratile]|nr:MAG: hypothetical protein M1839_002327 [Geoglossum umbratile]
MAASGQRSTGMQRPTFFMSRGNGVFTPLIPADELPIDVAIVGVPKVMSFAQTTGMTSVGEVVASGLHYEVKLENDIDRQPGVKPPLMSPTFHTSGTALARQALFMGDGLGISSLPYSSAMSGPSTPATGSPSQTNSNMGFKWPDNRQSGGPNRGDTTDRSEGPPVGSAGLDKENLELASQETDLDAPRRSPLGAQAVIDAITSSTRTTVRAPLSDRVFQRSNKPGNGPLKDGSKTYCSYWLRHGECDYTQQGCKYMHEMPEDRDTLSRIGLRDYPRWWKELNALSPLAWRQQRPPGPGDKASPTATPQSPAVNGAEENTAAAIVRGEGASTPPPKGPIIRQRVLRIRDSGAEHQSASPSPAKISKTTAVPPEDPRAPRFVPGAMPPYARALRVQRLMSPESSPEGGVSVQADTARPRRIDAETKDTEPSLACLEGLRLG